MDIIYITYDVSIIGGIISYQLSNIISEKNPVLADETTRDNYGAIHGGFDPIPNKVEAELNVLGNQLWRDENYIFQKQNR